MRHLRKSDVHPLKRTLAVFLSVLVVFLSAPIGPAVVAATANIPSGVTVTVTDGTDPIVGAQISGTISSVSGSSTVSINAQTDANGEVTIFSEDPLAQSDYVISGTVTKAGYSDGALNASITDPDQNILVALTSKSISGITVTANTLTYTGEPQAAVTVNGTESGDTITYKIDGAASANGMVTNAGTYSVEVTISRENFDDLVETVPVTVSPQPLGISIAAKTGLEYTGSDQELVTLTGSFDSHDSVKWTVDGTETANLGVPAASSVGDHKVRLQVTRMKDDGVTQDSNYVIYDSGEITVAISKASLNLSGLTVTPYNGEYDGNSHPAFTVVPETSSDYTVQYSTSEGGTYSSLPAPEITNAGSYDYWIKAVSKDPNHADSSPVKYTAVITKKSQSMTVAFNGANYTQDANADVTLQITQGLPWGAEVTPYDIVGEAVGNPTGNAVTFSVDRTDVAELNSTGSGTVSLSPKNPGTVVITAHVDGNTNYDEASLSITLQIYSELPEKGKILKFAGITDGKIADYTLGTSNGEVSTQQATKVSLLDMGDIKYSVAPEQSGLAVAADGKVTVDNYFKVAKKANENGGSFTYTVKAVKSEVAGLITGKTYYPSDEATYTVTVKFAEIPSGFQYVLAAKETDTGPNAAGWYTGPVVLSFASVFTDAQTAAGKTWKLANAGVDDSQDEAADLTFGDTCEFSDEGDAVRGIYLKDNDTGAITKKIDISDVKIDTIAPTDVNISYPDEGTLLHDLTFGFYNPSVTITFTAEDASSGLDYVSWEYIPQENQSPVNRGEANGRISFADGKAELVLPLSEAEQYRGSIAFTVYDKAGNAAQRQVDGRIVVVDTISPTATVNYTSPVNTVDGVEYYKEPGQIEVTLNITEANFFSEDVEVTLTKDGTESDISDTVAWNDSSLQENDLYVGTFTISGDGRYSFGVSYTDRSENTPVSYSSPQFVIDTVASVLTSSFDQSAQSISFSITERFFPEGDFVVTASARTITGGTVSTGDITALLTEKSNWSGANGNYACSTAELPDGIYNISIEYTDYATNVGSTTAEEFIIDHTAPTDTEISYSTPLTETLLNAVTLGFYNPSVEVTFSAVDQTSGVESFTWSYTKQDGASDTNVAYYADTVVEAVQDNGDTSRFTATITLPASEAEQIRGSVAVTATDKSGNAGDKVTDNGKVIVVDTIAPTLTVEYSEASRMVGTTSYYGNDKDGKVNITFKVTEANFFAEDVQVTISKNDGVAESVTPDWSDESADVHVGTYTISEDGHYIVNVTYTDRSNNTMSAYTSDMLTVDTSVPEIRVEYQNTNVINTLADADGNQRKYFGAVQTAVVTVQEHNFDENEVEFTISGTDVGGSTLGIDNLISRSAWSNDGDTHKMTITYSGDANYNFDVAYKDLAENAAADYTEDHFTVDQTNPVGLSVNYSTSVLDTILENLTFGFYNAPVTVTLNALDATSGIYSFEYSYTVAGGVSGVNSSLSGQTIPMESITYADGGRSATATFTIPNGTLGPNNQFNGNVDFSARDRSNNQSELTETRRIIVDNISSTAEVVYREEVNKEGTVHFFDAPIEATVTINEANFYSDDVTVSVRKDDAEYPVDVSWANENADVHNGTFTLDEDGDYFVSISYQDKSNNSMEEYTSEQLTLDTVLTAPVFGFNSGTAYKGKAAPSLRFSDDNFDHFELALTRVKTYKKDKVVEMSGTATSFSPGEEETFTFDEGTSNQKKERIKTEYTVTLSEDKGDYIVSFDDFDEKMQEYDGIYTLSMTLFDKAGHSEPTDEGATSAMFTVNRFGSVYVYNDYLSSLVKDGGAYVQSVEEDLVVTEYNADKLVEESVNIDVTRDGRPMDEVNYSSSPTVNDHVTVGDSGWYQYEYRVKQDNFSSDGVYKMSVSSKDKTGNAPENTNYEDMDILFRVDSTPPEITGVTGLEERIINAQEVQVEYTVFDAIGLKSISPEVDGSVVGSSITEFTDDMNNFSGAFALKESGSAQKVRLLVEDMAGNVTDTDSDDFTSAYPFERAVTVSTNAFVRWYANQPLFWGSIAGGGVVIAAGTGGVAMLRKRGKRAK